MSCPRSSQPPALRRPEAGGSNRSAPGGGRWSHCLANDGALLDQVSQIAAYQADAQLRADPFYVRLLAEDAAAKRLTPANLAQQPRGLNQYLDSWWQRLKQQAGDQPTRDLFGTLTVALGPLRQAELEALNPSLVDAWAADFFTDEVLPRVQRWVVGDPQRGYALAHPRLRQYMQTRLKTAPYLDKLLAYCANWLQHHSPYAPNYYATHLRATGQTEALFKLVRDEAYRAAQLDTLGDASASLNDLRLALEVTLTNDDLGAILACVGAYREPVRSQGLTRAIFDALNGGDFSRALKLASFYRTARDWPRVLHLYLAWEAALVGAKADCRQAIQSAEPLYQVQTGSLYDALLVRIANTWLRTIRPAPERS